MGLGGNEVFQPDTGLEKEAERTLGWALPAGPAEAGEHAGRPTGDSGVGALSIRMQGTVKNRVRSPRGFPFF